MVFPLPFRPATISIIFDFEDKRFARKLTPYRLMRIFISQFNPVLRSEHEVFDCNLGHSQNVHHDDSELLIQRDLRPAAYNI